MSLAKKYGPIAGKLSMNQYCPPACYELAGNRFEFVLDTGEISGDAVLNFLDETRVEWRIEGSDGLKSEIYECRKADNQTYLVTYCLDSGTPGENHTWVGDRNFVFTGQAEMNSICKFGINIGVFWSEFVV